MSLSLQTKVMLKKNWLVKKKAPIALFCQLFLPLILLSIIVIARQNIHVHYEDESIFSVSQAYMTNRPLGFVFPHTNATAEERELARSILNEVNPGADLLIYATESDLTNKAWDDSLTMGIIFTQTGFTDKKWSYTVRSTRDYTFFNEAVSLQHVTDNQILALSNQAAADTSEGSYLEFPEHPERVDDFSKVLLGIIMPILFLVPFLYTFVKMVVDIVNEKEHRLKEGMGTMGLKPVVFWVSWTVTNLILTLTMIIMLVIMLTAGEVFSHSDGFCIFILFFMFGISKVAFANVLTNLFSRARTAAFISILLYIIAYSGTIVSVAVDINSGLKTVISFLSPSAFGMALQVVAKLEEDQVGLSWDTMNEERENFQVGTAILMMFFDTIIYCLLTFYLDKVLPSEFGLRRSPCFCLDSLWSACSGSRNDYEEDNKRDLLMEHRNVVPPCPAHEAVEPVPQELEQQRDAVHIRGLSKTFTGHGTTTIAVDDLNLDMYKGQVFCLLGHNGAGKTTTMNMLTGMLTPSDGSAWIAGHSIRDGMDRIRQELGVCPQHSILWPTLTVLEHLQIYAVLKGVPAESIDHECVNTIAMVGLTPRTNFQSKDLSGGMQRKLSVAIALIGNPGIVFLDEPTSGMDPASRRFTQDLIRRIKRDRVVVLTTHYMEEADALADRIGIMSHGRLLTCGSSLYLKSRFGVGYCFVVTTAQSGSDQNGIKEVIMAHVPDAKMVTSVGTELTFELPLHSCERFADMLEELDAKKPDLGLEHYTISVTTLEEVFLKVAAQEASSSAIRKSDLEFKTHDDYHDTKDDFEDEKHSVKLSSLSDKPVQADSILISLDPSPDMFDDGATCFTHIGSLYQKRYRRAKRDRQAICCQIIAPLILLLIGFSIVSSISISNKDLVSLSPKSRYPTPLTVVYNSDPNGEGSCTSAAAIPRLDPTYYTPLQVNPDMDSYDFDRWILENPQTNLYGGIWFSAANGDVVPAAQRDYDATMSFANLINTACYQVASGDNTADISTAYHEFPVSEDDKKDTSSAKASVMSFFISIGFAFIPASFVSFLVKEKKIKAKHQQLLSGVRGISYWVSAFLWDLTSYSIPCVCSIILLKIMNLEALEHADKFEATCVVFLVYGPCVVAFTLAASLLFQEPGHAQTAMILWYIFSGLFLTIVAAILGLIIPGDTAYNMTFVWRVFPNYALTDALSAIVSGEGYGGDGDDDDSNNDYSSAYDRDIAGYDIWYMVFSTFGYLFICFLVDFIKASPYVRSCGKSGQPPATYGVVEDVDVVNERVRMQDPNQDDVVQIKGLRKTFGNVTAVQDLWYGVPQGQCFGFLGVNGAGKTTTLSMLSGELVPTYGDASLGGFDIQTQQQELRRLLGYCPQIDPLYELLTGREHLELYGKIKGIRPERLDKAVNEMLSSLSLQPYADKLSGGYSGGNKRKLSVACALIGSPPIVFLDEPSTGMDPVSRRFMWEFISRTMKGRSVILTTHSMEEAENLCQRIGIMVNGQLKCLGTPNHLKSKFGQGFTLDIILDAAGINSAPVPAGAGAPQNIAPPQPVSYAPPSQDDQKQHLLGSGFTQTHVYDSASYGTTPATMSHDDGMTQALHFHVNRLIQHCFQIFPNCRVLECLGGHVKFHVAANQATSAPYIFRQIEAIKADFHIREYSVSQTTLEQVFLLFAGHGSDVNGGAGVPMANLQPHQPSYTQSQSHQQQPPHQQQVQQVQQQIPQPRLSDEPSRLY